MGFNKLYCFEGAFRKLVDIMFVGAMGPPGGGRNPITPRFSRHFNHISFTELEDSSKFTIFSTIVASWLGSFQNAETLVSLAESLSKQCQTHFRVTFEIVL